MFWVMSDVLSVPGFLSTSEQVEIVRAVMAVRPSFYTPRTRFGRPFNLQMLCLGRHWSARDYKYHAVRVDADGLECPAIPAVLQEVARRAVVGTGYLGERDYRPYDICIANLYPEGTGKLGEHVDNSESKEAIESGYPVCSLSIGASCLFRMGGLSRTDSYEEMRLDSGHLIVFGRTRRLAYHGVKRTLEGTTPAGLGLPGACRLNLTFRVG
jgi:DNA oxidative demethylase